MRKSVRWSLTAILLTVLFCIPATAGEGSPHSISGWVALGTDYYSKGITTTENSPAVQGEIDYEHDCGLYAGVWASNIAGDSEYVDDYDEWTYATKEGNIEIDFWIGFWKEVGPVELDFQAMYLYYPENADSGLVKDPDYDDWFKGEAEADYVEFHFGIAHRFNIPTVPKLSLGYDYSPDYWGEDGTMHHFNAIVNLGLPFDFEMEFEAGWESVEGDKQTGSDSSGYSYGVDGEDGFEYAYYRVGVGWEIYRGLRADLNYHFGMSEKEWVKGYYGYDAAKDRFILTVSYTF